MNNKLHGIIDVLREDHDREVEAEALYQYVNQVMLNELTPVTQLKMDIVEKRNISVHIGQIVHY